jgi:hypothetical protein
MVRVVNNFGANTVIVSALGAVVKLAGETSLPVAVRCVAALVTRVIASVIVICAYRLELGAPTTIK